MEHEGDSDTNCNWCTWNNLQKFDREIRRLRNQRSSRERLNNSIIKIGQNTEKNPGDLRSLKLQRKPIMLTLVWKTLKWVCGDRDETINHIISECSNLAQKEYKASHDWVGKVVHREMWRKFQFDHTNKWYMHNPASVLENDSHKLLWDFNIQTDHLIPARRPDLIIINNKKKKKENL